MGTGNQSGRKARLVSVRFLRIVGMHAKLPARDARVIAIVNDKQVVKWSIRDGFTCRNCTDPEDSEYECDHVNAVADLLDPRVIGEDVATP